MLSVRGMSRILILEDDQAVAGVYSTALTIAGHDVAVFHQFEEARKDMKRHPPDGLLTDVRVAEYNGLQLALLYRMLSPNGRILVVSGHDDVAMREEAGNIDADFRVKPVDLNALTSYFSAS